MENSSPTAAIITRILQKSRALAMHLAFYVHTLLLSHSQLSFSALIVKYVWLSRYKIELFVNKWHFCFVWTSVVKSRYRVLISRTRRPVASVLYIHSAFEFWYYWLFSFRTACSLIKLGGYFLKTSEVFIFLRLDLRCSSRFFLFVSVVLCTLWTVKLQRSWEWCGT